MIKLLNDVLSIGKTVECTGKVNEDLLCGIVIDSSCTGMALPHMISGVGSDFLLVAALVKLTMKTHSLSPNLCTMLSISVCSDR